MRITGGRLKGRRLISPKGLKIRPTSDRVREAIFDLIGHDLMGFLVADLFAGTGILGIEALSRGARRALFVDQSHQAVQLIKRNLALCGVEQAGVVIKWDLRRGIPGVNLLPAEGLSLVFLDPPYLKELVPQVLEQLSDRNLLTYESRVIAETSKVETPPTSVGGLSMIDSRLYGDTRISVYALED